MDWGWKAYDITPKDVDEKASIVAVDVYQPNRACFGSEKATEDSQPKVHIVTATKATIFHTTITVSEISWDEVSGSLVGFSPDTITWQSVRNNLGTKAITTLSCGPTPADQDGNRTGAEFKIFVGTERAKDAAAWHYIVDPSPDREKPWTLVPMAHASKKVLATQPGSLNFSEAGVAMFTLFEQTGAGGCQCSWCLVHKDPNALVAYGCDVDGVTEQFGSSEESVIKLDIPVSLCPFGTVRNISSSVNPEGTTDILVAGDGIGFVDATHPDMYQPQCHVLKGTEFSQVVGVEKAINEDETSIYIFALSADGDLYFVEGSRTPSTENDEMIMRFLEPSGLPIRKDVAQISGQFNASANVAELLYATSVGNEVKHLLRDPMTGVWLETALTIHNMSQLADPNAQVPKITYPAFVTKIRICGENDLDLAPEGYPIRITSDMPCFVTANDKGLALGLRQKEITTNSLGEITIVSRVHGVLGAPNYKLYLFKHCTETQMNDKKNQINIQPAQRIIRILRNVRTADDIKNAKTTTGKPVFDDSQKRDYASAAGMLQNFPEMMDLVGKNPNQPQDHAVESDSDTVLIASLEQGEPKVETTQVANSSLPDWLDGAITSTGKFLGDCIEFIEKWFKKILRVVVRFCGPIIKLYLWLEDKIIELVLGSAIAVLRTIGSFLKHTLGINFSFLGWLGLLLDIEDAKKTQAALKDVINNAISVARCALPPIESKINSFISSSKTQLEEALNVPVTVPPKSSLKLPDWLSKLFNNPIIDAILKWNPIGWAMEVFMEEFESMGIEIRVPDPSQLLDKISATVMEWLTHNGATFLDLGVQFMVIAPQIIANLTNPTQCIVELKKILGSLLGTVFEAVSTLVSSVFKILIDAFGELDKLLNFEWKFPILTKLWKVLAEQEFSIINAITFLSAQFINAWAQILGIKDPAGLIGDFSNVLRELSEKEERNSVILKRPRADSTVHIAEVTVKREKRDEALMKGSEMKGIANNVNFFALPHAAMLQENVWKDSHNRRLADDSGEAEKKAEEEKEKAINAALRNVKIASMVSALLRLASTLNNIFLKGVMLRRAQARKVKRVGPSGPSTVDPEPTSRPPAGGNVRVDDVELDAIVLQEKEALKIRSRDKKPMTIDGSKFKSPEHDNFIKKTSETVMHVFEIEPKPPQVPISSKKKLDLWEKISDGVDVILWLFQLICEIAHSAFSGQVGDIPDVEWGCLSVSIISGSFGAACKGLKHGIRRFDWCKNNPGIRKILEYLGNSGIDELLNRVAELLNALLRLFLKPRGGNGETAEEIKLERWAEGCFAGAAVAGIVQGIIHLLGRSTDLPWVTFGAMVADAGGTIGGVVCTYNSFKIEMAK
ncbi:hypothetical protein BJ508DRAFT_33651 [Ascobolus immersus RN42]|uniref:Uncharacterized protein n=1 Tax=Ascobolus immersus RN42 TaxID=1160509 RepID=A0A3N4HS13_ASCIM|nr:hypothetical protein BJ508DRAFT_33651 [Ascobolus immersus RN42]